ncbi:tetratricopeptide repeat protein [Leptothoe sp. PORK10 BA2]|uniref:tetratricopeptide repeat protein n=1 Tax=Leptothoe sp. PORK10 BA2 TaxID=3110254 RepID=UPI002B21ECF2|nr:tetratricopeptide repeat protein [Leptothoe sp. PORK10 BA2]MEA5462630.1 tetratricopeptide repeat protein [Leptothoe sp. PORK10 BA2]
MNLSIYDNEDMLRSVVRLLEKARQQNANHVPSLVLLSDLLMQLNADGEAMQVVESLLRLEPNNQTHARKKALIQQLRIERNDSNRNALREYVESRWTGTSDW